MSDGVNSQEKVLFDKLLQILKDPDKANVLNDFLLNLENNTIQQAINNATTINSIYSEAEKKRGEINSIREDVEDSQKYINEAYNEIYDINDDNLSLEDSSNILKSIRQANENAEEINETYYRFYGSKAVGENVKDGIISKLEQACNDIEEANDQIQELKKFYIEVFEGVNDDNNPKNNKQSLCDFIGTQKQELFKTIKRTREDFDLLKNKIEGLLPGATTAGLAKAYKDQREDAEKNIQSWDKIFWWSVGLFIVVFLVYFCISFKEGFSAVSFFRSLPLWIFSGFFTFYSTQQISEYKKIANEYRHKEALSSSYVGFEKLILETENEALNSKLLEIAVDAIKINPNDKFGNKGSHPSMAVLEKTIEMLPLNLLKKIKNLVDDLLNIKSSNS